MSLDVARSEAARVAACVELRDIRLWEVEAELAGMPDGALSYGFDVDIQVHQAEEQPAILILGNFQVAIREKPGEDAEQGAEPEDIASLKFQLNALFEIERMPEDGFTEDELNAFGETTGQFALYPYAREFVSTMTGRMGLPPLHLGVMRLDLEKRADD